VDIVIIDIVIIDIVIIDIVIIDIVLVIKKKQKTTTPRIIDMTGD
jgi:hypothetical protein